MPPPEPDDGEVLIRVHAASVNPIDALPASTIPRKPDAITHEQAAAIPVAGLTAWQALFDCGGLTAGQVALISGGNRGFVLGLGADHYVDFTRKDVADAVSGVDVTLDTVGGKTPRSLLGAVRDGGILLGIAGGCLSRRLARAACAPGGFGWTQTPTSSVWIAALVVLGQYASRSPRSCRSPR